MQRWLHDIKHGLDVFERLQHMCGRLWGYRDDRKLSWLYRMYCRQLQVQRRKCVVHCLCSGLLYPKYWLYCCQQL